MKRRCQLYEEVSSKKGKGVKIRQNLCFYTPEDVYKAVTHDRSIMKWLSFISNHYLPPSDKKILLVFPCSTEKPYHKSRSYRMLFKTLDKLGEGRRLVHLVTISEPYGLVPEEFYGKKTEWHDWKNEWYDCPGLFEWWCKRHNQPYSQEYVEKTVDSLSQYVARFFMKAKTGNCYSKIIAFVRPCTSTLITRKDHTHRRIIERAAETAGVEVEIIPTKRVVSKIVKERGRMAWDMYGVAHPIAQVYLLRHLKGILNHEAN